MTTGHSALADRNTLIMMLIAYALLAFNLSILLTESQHIPKTCKCPQVRKRVQGPFSNFTVAPKGPSCLEDEIIVVRQENNKSVCLSPEGKQGKRLLQCWQRMQRDGKDSKYCLRRKKQKQRRRNPKKVTS